MGERLKDCLKSNYYMEHFQIYVINNIKTDGVGDVSKGIGPLDRRDLSEQPITSEHSGMMQSKLLLVGISNSVTFFSFGRYKQ